MDEADFQKLQAALEAALKGVGGGASSASGGGGGISRSANSSIQFAPGRETGANLRALLEMGIAGPILGAMAQFPKPQFGNNAGGPSIQEQAVRALGTSDMGIEAPRRSSGGGRAGRRGGGLGSTKRFPGPTKTEYQRKVEARRDRAEREGERRSALEFEMALRNREQENRLKLIQQLLGGVPKKINTTEQQLVNVAGGFVPRTVTRQEDRDITPLIARLF